MVDFNKGFVDVNSVLPNNLSYENEILPVEFRKKGVNRVKWSISPLTKEKFKVKVRDNPSFAKVFNSNFNQTKVFLSELKFRSSGERNIILEVIGQTGSGKSNCSQALAQKYMFGDIVAEDIVFTSDDLLSRAYSCGKNHTLIRDEQIGQAGVGSMRERGEIQNLEETTRKFGLNIIFCSPHSREHDTAHYILEVLCVNYKYRLTKLALMSELGKYIGYIVIKVLPESNRVWKEYNKLKDKFIKSVMGRDIKRLSLDDKAMGLVKHKHFSVCRTRSEQILCSMDMYPTLTSQEHQHIVDKYRLLSRLGEL